MQSLEEREMEERDRERKKEITRPCRGHVINDTRGGRIIFITTNS